VKEVRVVKRLDAFPVKEKAAVEDEVEHAWVKRSPAVSCVGTPVRSRSIPVSVEGSPVASRAVPHSDCFPSKPVSCVASPAVSRVVTPLRSPSRAATPSRATPNRSPAKAVSVSGMATPEHFPVYTINFSDFDSTMMTPSILMSPVCEVQESSARKVESPVPVIAGKGVEVGEDESDDGSVTVIMDKTWRMEESMDGDSVTLVKEGENLDQDFLTDDEDNNNDNNNDHDRDEAFISVLSERPGEGQGEGQREEDKEEDSNDSRTVLQVCVCCVAALTPSHYHSLRKYYHTIIVQPPHPL
jgi:hypothetical protein